MINEGVTLRVLLLAALAAPTCGAGTGLLWEGFGPGGGGWIEDVLSHPTNPQEAWCVTDLTGPFQTLDGGLTWRQRATVVQHRMMARKQIYSYNRVFAIDPKEPRHLYWGTSNRVWASHDGGETWDVAYGQFPTFGDPKPLSQGITLSVGPDGTVYALDYALVLRASRDHGATWHELARPPVKSAHPLTPPFPFAGLDGTLYVSGRSPEGLAVSHDGGKAWDLLLKGSVVLNLQHASDRTTRPSTVFALDAAGGVHRTDDGGKSFEKVATVRHAWQPGRRFPGGLAVAPDGTVMVWAQREQKLSRDWGKTWQPFSIDRKWSLGSYPGMNRYGSPEGKCSGLAVSCDGTTWLKCDSSLMARSLDAGGSWTGCATGINILCYANGPAVSSQDPATVFVGAYDQGVFLTRDDGKTWKAANTDPAHWGDDWENNHAPFVRQHPTDPKTWFCVRHLLRDDKVKPRMFRSTDAGETWSLVLHIDQQFGGEGAGRNHLVFDPSNPDTMHLSDFALGVMTSRDGGKTWEHNLKATNGVQLAVSPSGQHVYLQCLKKHGLYASHDRGKTWELARKEGWGLDGIAHHPKEETTLFITTGQLANYWDHKGQRPGSLWKSTDAGKTWAELGQFDGGGLYVDPVKPQVMLMSTLAGGKGVVRSTDGGRTWQPCNEGIPSYTCTGFTYGGKPGRVYCHNNDGTMGRCEDLYRGMP